MLPHSISEMRENSDRMSTQQNEGLIWIDLRMGFLEL